MINHRRLTLCFPGLLSMLLLGGSVGLAWFLGVRLSGQYEESLGYRYFYSLRQIADADTYVFLPQGHLIDTFHQALNLLLNLVGPPMTDVATRIEVFGYGSVLTAHLLVSIAVAWLASYQTGVARKLLVTLLAVLPYFIPAIYGFSNLLVPDYLVWIPVVTTVTAALVTRAFHSPNGPWTGIDTASVAGLTAIALGVKVSLLVFPAALGGILLIMRERLLRSALLGTLSLLLGITGWLLILVVNFHGRTDHLLHFFRDQSIFLQSVGTTMPFVQWWSGTIGKAVWVVRACALLPLGLAVVALTARRRPGVALAVGLGLGSAGSLFILHSRDNPTTWQEATCYLCFSIAVLLCARPAAPARIFRLVLNWLVVAALGVQVAIGLHHYIRYFLPYLTSLTPAQQAAATALEGSDDRIAFLIPDNSYRPLTLDSAVWKGGANILEGGRFGASPLVRSFFPHRNYFYGAPESFAANPLDLAGFTRLVFVIRKGMDPDDPVEHRRLMSAYYSTPLDWTLLAKIDFKSQFYLVWQRTDLASQSASGLVAPAAKRLTPTLIELTWPRGLFSGQCEIQMSTNGGDFVTIGLTTGSLGVYQIGDVGPASSYSFRLRAQNNRGPDGWTPVAKVSPAIQ